MKILLAHAKYNEVGQTAGGKAGDQTKQEVCVQEFFEHEWEWILRPIDKNVAEGMARDAELAAVNDNIGYNQPDRYSFYEQAKKHNYDISKIDKSCNTDCSQLTTTLAIANGVPRLSKYVWTANMIEAFQYTKAFEIFPYANKTQLRRGDVLLTVTKHHVVIITQGYDDSDPAYSTVPKWRGMGYGAELIPVYADQTMKKKLSAYPNLGVGNLFDVCDEAGDLCYVRIAGKYFGWVQRIYILRDRPAYAKGTVQTALNFRTNPGTEFKSLGVIPVNTVVDVFDTKPTKTGTPWYYIQYKGIYGFASARYIKLK